LDIIEQAIHALNVQPAQVSLQARVFHLHPKLAAVDLPKLLKRLGLAGRELVSTNELLLPALLNEQGSEPILEWAREAKKSLGVPVNSTVDLIPALEYVVPANNAKTLIDELLGGPEVDGMTLPVVTTLVGRLAHVSVEESRTVVTDRTVVKNGVIVAGAPSIPLGPVTRILPELVTEKGTQFNVSYNLTEFVGYDGSEEAPRPKIRVRTTTSNVMIPHGFTQVIVVQGGDKSQVWMLTPTVIDSRGMPVFK